MCNKNPECVKELPRNPPHIIFPKNVYGPSIKVENWHLWACTEPKDNYVYRDKLSNQLSTYRRWGTDDQGARSTETQDMLEQICTKTDPIYVYKPLVNFTSYSCADTPKRDKLIRRANLEELPVDYGFMDYMTTQKSDYRNPYPSTVIKPLTMASTPWLMYRIICSNVTQNHGTAPPRGSYDYLDLHTPIDHIRKLRQCRYKSFDPSTCQQSFPAAELN